MEKSLFNKKVLAEKEHFHEKVLLYFHKAKNKKMNSITKKKTLFYNYFFSSVIFSG